MALNDALSPIQATNCIDISFKQAIIKALRQVYDDIAAGAIIIQAGDPGITPGEGDPITLVVDDSTPGVYTLSILGDV